MAEEDEFTGFLDNGRVVQRPRAPRSMQEMEDMTAGTLWERAWQVLMMLCAFVAVILLGLILHCCLHKDVDGGPLPTNESASVVLAIGHAPITVNGTVNVTATEPLPINGTVAAFITDPVEVYGAVDIGLPLGECAANESLCVSFASDAAPIDVNIVNGNITINATISPIVQAEIIGPFGGECDANSSLCVSLSPETVVTLGNSSLNVTLGSPAEVTIINPLPLPVVIENFTIDAVTVANDTLTVTLDGVGTSSFECSSNSSLCVSLYQDGPLIVEVVNQPPVSFGNATLDVTVTNDTLSVALDGVATSAGECSSNSSLCVSVYQDGPLIVEVVNQQPINFDNITLMVDAVTVANDTLSVTVDGVATNAGECGANSSLCVSLFQDAPLIVEVINQQPIVLENFTVDIGSVTVANDTLAVTVDGVATNAGECGANSSLCVSLFQDAPLIVEVINQQPIVFENFTVDIGSVTVANDTLSVALDGVATTAGECSANSSLCVSFFQDTPLSVEVLNSVAVANETLQVELVNASLSVDPIVIANSSLSVELVGVGTSVGECSANSSLCVSLFQDTPLSVEVINQQPIHFDNITLILDAVTIANSSLQVSPVIVANDTLSVELNGVATSVGECSANSSLCVSLFQDTPLSVEVTNFGNITLIVDAVTIANSSLQVSPVIVANDTLSVELDGVATNAGECSANSSLCVSLFQDAPLDVSLGDQPVQVVNAPGEILQVQVANFSIVILPELNVTIVGPLGPNTPVDQAVAVTLTNNGSIVVQQSSNTTDLFGRTRVSEARSLFDFKTINLANEILSFDDSQVSGSGTSATFNANLAAILQGVSTLTAGSRVRQTLRRFNYQPGNTHVIYMTVRPSDTPAGIVKRWGYFDEDNGLFFQTSNNNQVFAVVRSSTTGVPVDTLFDITGSLPPGFQVDDLTMWSIEFAWMGATNLRFGLYRGAELNILYQTATPMDFVWTSMPNLPLRIEITNDGTGPASTISSSAMTVRSEGATSPIVQSFSVDRGSDWISITSDGVMHPLIGVRLDVPTYEGASALLNAITHVALDGNVIYRWALLYRADITGEVPMWTSRPESPLESASPTSDAVCSGGQQFASGYVVGTAQTAGGRFDAPPQVYLGTQLDGTPLELWLCEIGRASCRERV